MHSHAKPVSTVYSKEMRDLVAALLTKDPKYRLDVRGVLKLPFVRAAAEEMLGAAQAQSKASRPVTAASAAASTPSEKEARPERKKTLPKEASPAPSRGSSGAGARKVERSVYNLEH